MDKVTGQCPPTTTFLKRKERRSGIDSSDDVTDGTERHNLYRPTCLFYFIIFVRFILIFSFAFSIFIIFICLNQTVSSLKLCG